MKKHEEIAEKIIDEFTDEFPYGYWDGVCDCCTGFENKEDAVKEHLSKKLKELFLNNK